MPTLFISYKRGTSAVAPIMERLRAAHYRLWFDRDEIHLGDADWQAKIDHGLQACAAAILMVTPAACDSIPVQYELKKARELGKPIFPIILEKIASYDDAISKLGLAPKQHIEDFTDVTQWDAQIKRLIRDLDAQGLFVTRHDFRRERGHEARDLHQRYLSRLVERVGTLSLAAIAPEDGGMVNLEAVYVDSSTPLKISVEVTDWHVTDWWISQSQDRENRFGEEAAKASRVRPHDLGYDVPPLETLIERVEARIEAYRKQYPTEKPTDSMNSWKNGNHSNVLMLNVQHIAAARDRLVLLGKPGGGKSTFVKHLALCLAGAQIEGWGRAANLDQLEAWTHGTLTPIYIELRRLVASKHFPADVHTQPDASHLWNYIKAELLGDELATYATDLERDLEEGNALLILDGLDEVPFPEGKLKARQRQLQSLAAAIHTRYGKSRVVVASRPYAYEGWKLPGFEAVEVADLEDHQRLSLANRLYRVSGLGEQEANEKAGRLNTELQARRIHPELRDRPLFLTQMAALYLKNEGTLPTRRGTLYRQIIELLLNRWTKTKAETPSLIDLLGGATLLDLFTRLAALAYDVHSTSGEQRDTPEIDEDKLYKHLKPMGRHIAADLIVYLSENAGVLVCPGQNAERDVFHFAHRTFQEYLAAVHVIALCDEQTSFALVRSLIEAKPTLWREVGMLVGDALTDASRNGDLWDLLDDLLDDDVPDTLSKEDPRWWSVWLAGEIAREQELHLRDKLRKGEKAVRDSLVEWQVKLIGTGAALRPPERAASGRVLALLGDTRPRIGLRPDGLPDIDWVEIPAGKFLMGSDQAKDPEAQDDELPQREVLLPAYRISKYPITNAQFAAFVGATDGYNNPAWWTAAGLDWKADRTAPDEHSDPDFRLSNHPRIDVCWYEAVAFCRWLSAKLGNEVRLPTEAEWEKAARGTDGRIYPYGDTFDAAKGNTDATKIGTTSAVGLFPDGASPYGVLDMSGNVWEWCATKGRGSYAEPADDDLNGTDGRVLRGGSWNYGPQGARAARRGSLYPGYWNLDLGFRVVLGSPPTSRSVL